jgi:hypothetical protein
MVRRIAQQPEFTVAFGASADIAPGSGDIRAGAYDPQETFAALDCCGAN